MSEQLRLSIVGGSGFIGTRLSEQLEAQSLDFEIIDIQPSLRFPNRHKNADVRDQASLEQAIAGNVIVNLAAVHRDDVRPKSLYDEVNVGGAQNICAVARDKGIESIVFTSSVAVYGFAPPDTGETGELEPFNEYGKTKAAAEKVFIDWYQEQPESRSLVIIRPTVVFGEGNRGNVYNLIKQIETGRFVMVGNGENRKSMAYVGNVAAFIRHSLSFSTGVHLYNYIDKPDLNMNELIAVCHSNLKKKPLLSRFRLPVPIGLVLGHMADAIGKISGRSFPISAIRVRKFLSTTQFSSKAPETGFIAPVSLKDGFTRTLKYEFLEDHNDRQLFYTE